MARTPTVPPLSQPMVDKEGRLTQAWYKFLTGEREYASNVNSGVNEAKASAAAALVTAESAAQTAQDQQSNDFMVSTSSPYAIVLSETLAEMTTPSVTVTPSGGTAPYTYAWTKVSGDDVTINSPTAAATTFTGTPEFNSSLSGVYRCTVTDNAAATASITVSVAISHIFITGFV